jgi:hypothetical protein
MPGESEHSSSKNNGPSDGPQNKTAIFLSGSSDFY